MNQEEVLLVDQDQDVQKIPRKGAIQKMQASLGQFLSSVFAAPKKRYRTSSCVKFKEIKERYIKWPLQKGSSVSFEAGSAKRASHVQNWSRGYLFFSALASEISKICKGSTERSVVPVSMSMLWSGPSTKVIYKTVEDSSRSFEEADGRTDNISQQYFDYGSLNRGTDIGVRLIYLLQGLGFVINIEKFSFAALLKLRFSRGRNKFKGCDLVLPEEKRNELVEQCQFLLKNPLVTIRELSQMIGRLASTTIAALPAPLLYRTMQLQDIIEFSIRKIAIQRWTYRRRWGQNWIGS